jgi:uncharacterized oxidoreductase
MELRNNTVLITGGGSGIGRGLAEAFHRLGNRVVVAGRRAEPLKEVCAANAGMEFVVLDVTDGEAVHDVAREVTARLPELNCVINNAGMQRACMTSWRASRWTRRR